MDDVVEFILAVKGLDPHVEQACLHGGCYRFHKVLAMAFAGAVPYMNAERDHVVTRVGNVLYDVTGRIGSVTGKAGDAYHRMDDTEIRVAEKWGVRK